MSERKVETVIQKVKTNLSQKSVSDLLSKDSMNSLMNTAKKKTAKYIKKKMQRQTAEENNLELEDVLFYHGASQAEMPIKDISNGIIQTKDNRYLGVLEILPINFKKKSEEEQDEIADTYGSVFARGDFKLQIKILSDSANPQELIKNIRKNCKNQDDPKIEAALNDYINKICRMGARNTVTKRYFYIYEYRDEDGRKTGAREDILRVMNERERSIIAIMKDCGNLCVVPAPEDRDMSILEFLYLFYNRQTSRYESLQERYARLRSDFAKFNEVTGMNKEIEYADLIAPKGLYFDNRKYVVMDGYYYGYLGIMGNSWPKFVQAGWFDYFDLGPTVDIDLICRKLPHEVTKAALGGGNFLTRNILNGRRFQGKNTSKLGSRYANNKKIFDRMDSGDPLYDAAIILTFRASTPQQLADNMFCVKRAFKKDKIAVDEGFLKCENYFRMTMPFLYITKPFRELKHNILGSDLATTYCYTTYELNDPTGFLLGLNIDDNSMTVINNFNTKYFKNGNMVILGTSGAGKTFTEQMQGRRMMFNGTRNFFIIPKKGYEYERGCEAVNGAYIQLNPGSKQRINIMEIRPEIEIDLSKINTDEIILQKTSWRAAKINNIIIWIQLLIGERMMTTREYNALNSGLVSIYESYGITEQNDSIFADKRKGILKRMPIIEDLYNYCKKVDILQEIKEVLETFVLGNCSNMNGQTNVDLNNEYVVFDINEDLIGAKLLPAFLYLAFDYVYTEIKTKSKSRDNVFLDEVWKMLKTANCAEQVQNMVKLVRGYGGATIMATQEIADFINAPGGFGQSVLSNSEIKLILNMKEDEIKLVGESLKLTNEDKKKIASYERGNGMLIANGNKISVALEPSDIEYNTFTTDVNDRI